MKYRIYLESRSLLRGVTDHDTQAFIRLTFEHFLNACLEAFKCTHAVDWRSYFQCVVQETYLELAVKGGSFTVVDHDTGSINTANCYKRYLELMLMLNQYYRLDVLAMITQLNHQHAVTALTYVEHTPHYVALDAHCIGLLTHDDKQPPYTAHPWG